MATDVAARGIDTTTVGLVINYNLPKVAKNYVYLIDHTARPGRSGKAISVHTSDERQYLDALEKLVKIFIKIIGDVPQSAPEDNKSSPKRRKDSKKKHFRPRNKVKNSQKRQSDQCHRGGEPRTNETAAKNQRVKTHPLPCAVG